jgi:hypothetical protein
MVLFAIGPLTQAVAFWLLLRLVGVARVRLSEALPVWSWSSLARYAPTGVGTFLVRVREAPRMAATRTQVLAVTLYEQAVLTVAVTLLSIACLLATGSRVPRFAIIVAVVGLVVWYMARPKVLGARLLRLIDASGTRLPQLPAGRGPALVGLLNVAGYCATGAAATVALAAFEHDHPNVVWVTGIYGFAWLVGFLTPMAPGGMGVREGVLALSLAPHYGLGVAVSLAIALRLVHTAGDLLASLLIELTYRLRRHAGETAAGGRILEVARQLRGLTRTGVE